MSVPTLKILAKQPTNIRLTGGPILEGSPFRVYPSAPNPDKTVDVRISEYSAIFNTFSVDSRVKLVGVNLALTIQYKDKIWIETFYDKNLEPVISLVRTGRKWLTTTKNPSNPTQRVPIYPNELEFITNLDISDRATQLDETLVYVESLRTLALAEILYLKNTGKYTDTQYSEVLEQLNIAYDNIRTALQDYKNGLSGFFSGAPSATWQKLFRTFTLICYTTKDTNLKLDGSVIKPKTIPPAVVPTIPTSSQSDDFKIVQTLNSDLLLADACYLNRYPARIPIPYHRPIYPVVIDGEIEDTIN